MTCECATRVLSIRQGVMELCCYTNWRQRRGSDKKFGYPRRREDGVLFRFICKNKYVYMKLWQCRESRLFASRTIDINGLRDGNDLEKMATIISFFPFLGWRRRGKCEFILNPNWLFSNTLTKSVLFLNTRNQQLFLLRHKNQIPFFTFSIKAKELL